MIIQNQHPWDLTTTEAIKLQKNLRSQLDVPSVSAMPVLIAGTDVSFNLRSNLLYGSVVICRYNDLSEIESRTAVMEVPFPYVPGLLSFREVPVLLEAFRKIQNIPDVILCDGQGIAHPRGFGLACHLGLFLDIPTIGCAKSRLCGEHDPVGEKKGDYVNLMYENTVVGMVLRSRTKVKPLYISTGYKTTLSYAKNIVLHTCPRYRVPEPNRKAHKLVNQLRRQSDN